MKIKNGIIACAFMVAALVGGKSHAKVIDYYDDAHAQQAPQELVSEVEKVAHDVGFEGDYQVIIPKKAGLQVNPWFRMAAYGINPQINIPFLVINPEWFSTLAHDQQTFLIARNLLILKHGPLPLSVKICPWIWALMMLCLMVLAFFAISRTRLGSQRILVRIIIVYAFFVIANLAFLNSLSTKLLSYLGRRFDTHINEMVIEKTQNRDAAVQALESIDVTIKKELAEGEVFWKPYEKTFATIADNIRK
jgi:hypothetical protein